MTQTFDLLSFIRHVAEMAIAIEVETHEALERAAKVVEKEAKAEIGTYQGSAGPFPAWAPLADRTMDEKERLGYAPPDNPLLREGELHDSIDHKVEGHEAAVGSDLDEAVYAELGTSQQPARSFLGGAAVREAPKVAEILGESVVAALIGGNFHKTDL